MPCSQITAKQITTTHPCTPAAEVAAAGSVLMHDQRSMRSFSGFLNCLDGLGAPDDVVIFMTTNHPDKLARILVVVLSSAQSPHWP